MKGILYNVHWMAENVTVIFQRKLARAIYLYLYSISKIEFT